MTLKCTYLKHDNITFSTLFPSCVSIIFTFSSRSIMVLLFYVLVFFGVNVINKILSTSIILLLSPNVMANVPTVFPVVSALEASQFDTSKMSNKSEMQRRKNAKSVPIAQAQRCIAFTYGSSSLGYGDRQGWTDHLKYFHDMSDRDVAIIKIKTERDMKSILAKSNVTWGDVHQTYFRECSGYYKITN